MGEDVKASEGDGDALYTPGGRSEVSSVREMPK